MIGLCYVLASLGLLAIALAGGLVVMLFTATAKATAMSQLADKRAAELDDLKLTVANQATTVAAAAEKAQEHRGDALEKEIATDASKPSDPAGAIDRLRDMSATEPGPGRSER